MSGDCSIAGSRTVQIIKCFLRPTPSCNAGYILMSLFKNNTHTTIPLCGVTRWWMSPMPLGKLTESPAVLTCHMSFPLRSSEESSGCSKYGKGRGGVFLHPHPHPPFSLGGVFVSLYCGHVLRARHFFPPCAFTHSDTDRTEVRIGKWSEEIPKRTKEKAKSTGGQALVEVVVCAVGRVVILPLVEMTAQSTALPALVTCDRGIKPDQPEELSSLCCLETE